MPKPEGYAWAGESGWRAAQSADQRDWRPKPTPQPLTAEQLCMLGRSAARGSIHGDDHSATDHLNEFGNLAVQHRGDRLLQLGDHPGDRGLPDHEHHAGDISAAVIR
jgi:hypothetical protein